MIGVRTSLKTRKDRDDRFGKLDDDKEEGVEEEAVAEEERVEEEASGEDSSEGDEDKICAGDTLDGKDGSKESKPVIDW